jgi:hypothetical protein
MIECLREQEVLEAVAAGRLDETLREHLAICSSCTDAAEVAAALRAEHDAAYEDAVIPAADVIWLRAQLRARAEATRVAARPIAIVQALGVACAVGAAAGLLGTTAWWLRSWAAWLANAVAVISSAPSTLEIANLAARGILLALCVWLVLAPVAVYLAATED